MRGGVAGQPRMRQALGKSLDGSTSFSNRAALARTLAGGGAAAAHRNDDVPEKMAVLTPILAAAARPARIFVTSDGPFVLTP